MEKTAVFASGVFENLFNRRDAFKDVSQSVLAEGSHPELLGFLLEHDGGGTLGDEVADGIRHVEQLEEPLSSLVTGVVAGVTTLTG